MNRSNVGTGDDVATSNDTELMNTAGDHDNCEKDLTTDVDVKKRSRKTKFKWSDLFILVSKYLGEKNRSGKSPVTFQEKFQFLRSIVQIAFIDN